MVAIETLIKDWNISSEEIKEQMKKDALERGSSSLFCWGDYTLNEKRSCAVREIARRKIDELIESIGKDMRAYRIFFDLMLLDIFLLWTLGVIYLATVIATAIKSPAASFFMAFIVAEIIGILVSIYVTFFFMELKHKKLKERYPWWFGRGGLYFDNIGVYYDEEMPAT